MSNEMRGNISEERKIMDTIQMVAIGLSCCLEVNRFTDAQLDLSLGIN